MGIPHRVGFVPLPLQKRHSGERSNMAVIMIPHFGLEHTKVPSVDCRRLELHCRQKLSDACGRLTETLGLMLSSRAEYLFEDLGIRHVFGQL